MDNNVLKLLKKVFDNPFYVITDDEIPVVAVVMTAEDLKNLLDMVYWRRSELDENDGMSALMKLESKYGVFADFRKAMVGCA